MRTDEEILKRIDEVKAEDFFGVIRSDLLGYLSFDKAKTFLKDGVTPEQWKMSPRDDVNVRHEIREYMKFAWEKANGCRGLSAGRSLNHMQAWLWMLGEDDAANRLMDEYQFYGKPQLRAICEKYGIDWQSLDDDHWTNDEVNEGVAAQDVSSLKLPWRA